MKEMLLAHQFAKASGKNEWQCKSENLLFLSNYGFIFCIAFHIPAIVGNVISVRNRQGQGCFEFFPRDSQRQMTLVKGYKLLTGKRSDLYIYVVLSMHNKCLVKIM